MIFFRCIARHEKAEAGGLEKRDSAPKIACSVDLFSLAREGRDGCEWQTGEDLLKGPSPPCKAA
jgi:hypothetical protein